MELGGEAEDARPPPRRGPWWEDASLGRAFVCSRPDASPAVNSGELLGRRPVPPGQGSTQCPGHVRRSAGERRSGAQHHHSPSLESVAGGLHLRTGFGKGAEGASTPIPGSREDSHAPSPTATHRLLCRRTPSAQPQPALAPASRLGHQGSCLHQRPPPAVSGTWKATGRKLAPAFLTSIPLPPPSLGVPVALHTRGLGPRSSPRTRAPP